MEMDNFNYFSDFWMMAESQNDESSLDQFELQAELQNINLTDFSKSHQGQNLFEIAPGQRNRTVIIFDRSEDYSALTNSAQSSKQDVENSEGQQQQQIQQEAKIVKDIIIEKERKRTNKRSQTTVSSKKEVSEIQKERDKLFLKRSKINIEKNFQYLAKLKSEFTKQIKTSQTHHSSKKKVIVKYFESQFSKTIKVNESILAIEFINIALQEYMKEPKFDQSLILFPNYSLAYQLKGLEDQFEGEEYYGQVRRPVQKSKSLEDQEGEDEIEEDQMDHQRIASQNDVIQEDISLSIEDQIIQIDLESKIQFKVVHLVANLDSSKFGIDLETVRMTYEQHPELIIVMVENEINMNICHIKINPNKTIDDLFDELIKKNSKTYTKKEFNLCLKYDCSNFGTDPLSLNLPIKYLPIHWLVLKSKYQSYIQTPSGEQKGSFERDFGLKDTFVSKSGGKSYRILNEDFQLLDKSKKLQQLYSYQEFILTKLDDRCANQVLIGIDYFDFYYSYKNERVKSFSLYRFAKNIVIQLFSEQDYVKNQAKRYRRIPLDKIIDVKASLKQDSFYLTYEKEKGYIKKLEFSYLKGEKDKEQNFNALQESFRKIEYLVEKRTRYKQFNC